MKILFILLIAVLFSVEIYAQREWEMNPVVVFKKEMKQNDDFLMIKTDVKSYNKDSICAFYMDLRRLDTKKKFSSGSQDPRPAHEWWAWLCDRALPEEVKQLFDISEKYFPPYTGVLNMNLIGYGGVPNEAKLELHLNDDFEILEVILEFSKPDLFASMSDERLKLICKKIVECQSSIKEVLRPYDPFEYASGEFAMETAEEEANKANMYAIDVFINGALKWAEKCKIEEPERWRAIVERFEKILAHRDAGDGA